MSMSVWAKITGITPGVQMMGCVDSGEAAGISGFCMQMVSGGGPPPGEGGGQFEWFTLNHSFPDPVNDPNNNGAEGLYGLIAHSNLSYIDGNWHNFVSTYDGSGVIAVCTSVPDSTHIAVVSTTGMVSGDRITQTRFSTTIVSVVDSTHIQVTSSTGFAAGYVYTRGLIMYVDGVPIFTYADYQQPLMVADYSTTLPFGIGDPQQLSNFSQIGKYAYPAMYYRVLSPSEVSAIAAGSNNTTGAVAQWLFTEGSGSTAADSSGNSHTLTFNAVSWDTDVPF